MGYYAKGDGRATVKAGLTKKEVRKMKKTLSATDALANDGGVEFLEKDGVMIIDWWESDDHWDEDEELAFLAAMSPYIDSGLVTFVGENDELFGFKFDSETGKWHGIDGVYVYDNDLSEFSDEVLIRELNARGYNVA